MHMCTKLAYLIRIVAPRGHKNIKLVSNYLYLKFLLLLVVKSKYDIQY